MSVASPSFPGPSQKQAWVTLLTRASYLPGAVLLAHSLHQTKSKYPLLILITPSFPSQLIPALTREVSLSNASLLVVEPLTPPPCNNPKKLIASRFEDTWTKLRVFSLHHYGYEKLIFLDADMLVLRNMDSLFLTDLPEDWIAANHACVCNLDHNSWAPANWTKENCAYTGLGQNRPPAPVPALKPHEGDDSWLEPHRLLNSGMFIFTPHESQWQAMLTFLSDDSRVKNFLFPDQDFLAAFFLGRWQSVGWQFNALKTMRYWHKEMWTDDEVRNLHYIVDKPWSKRIGSDGVAGYSGCDGVTHGWWWKELERWEEERMGLGESKALNMMRGQIAEPLHDDFVQEGLKKEEGNLESAG